MTTQERIDRLQEKANEITRKCDLYKPLVSLLLPIRKEYRLKDINDPSVYKIRLSKNEFEEQYKAGINKCVGFDIIWEV